MDPTRKQKFIELWQRFFPRAELPIGFYYTSDPDKAEHAEEVQGWHCFVAQLGAVRKGKACRFSEAAIGCPGGKRYLGFTADIMPDFRYFLSCGIEGRIEGERYKKTPELVDEIMSKMPTYAAPAPYIVFKRWDLFEMDEQPEVVIFFATPDVLSGLYTLAGFDEAELEAVAAPFGAGCASIVAYPYLEKDRQRPRAILGMFDVSARPCVPPQTLTFAVPMEKFNRMIDNMEQSFLTTPSWDKVKKRL
ncbi:MAG TPA: DUF169 domain-containing protein [Candidatus Bathyarchaeia archaeon]|nr:DUF169 domain-containing protein [Candidatus Bathyarchaeia archaeon]